MCTTQEVRRIGAEWRGWSSDQGLLPRAVARVSTPVSQLEELLVLDDNLRCQSPRAHRAGGKYFVPCSVEVTHHIRSACGLDALVCLNARDRAVRLQADGVGCAGCEELAEVCWEITPFG